MGCTVNPQALWHPFFSDVERIDYLATVAYREARLQHEYARTCAERGRPWNRERHLNESVGFQRRAAELSAESRLMRGVS